MTEPRFVEVAVDAPGVAGGQTYTYLVPPGLADLALGEAVLIEFGRRRAVGVVLAEAPRPAMEAKPLMARVRSDGPLLGDLGRRLALHVAEHYLAPPGLVVRAMLPPGTLERIELFAVPSADAVTASLLPAGGADDASVEALAARVRAAGEDGVAVDALPAAASRATLLRRLRQLEDRGELRLEWRVLAASARPRQERWALVTADGRAVAALLAAGERPPGPPLGARQRALLLELSDVAHAGAEAAPRLAERHGAGAVTSLARRGMLELETRTLERRALSGRAAPARGSRPAGSDLDLDQAAALQAVAAAIAAGHHEAFLLEGATASGKTTVYAEAIAASLAAGRGATILVPEIALATPLIDRLRHDLGEDVAILHSALADGERSDEWRRIASGEARVVVGTRMAVLVPPDPLGVVVVDEEHDPAYKSDRTPRYQARDVALALGQLAGAAVILGSATPDVVSVGLARQGRLRHLRLHGRRSGSPVAVELVDMRAELAEGNRGLISAPLAEALQALDRSAGDRAILLINRRGAASVVLCRDCGYVQVCPECQRPLVFHAAVVALRCHHCGATAPVARRCPGCGSVRIRYLGGGTERVEQELGIRFPDLRVARLDRDVVERKGAADRVIDDFTEGRTDVLVGTSLVAKGLDVPEVTLVGVVSADIALNLPDERAAERTWQLLCQAVGRAGRGERPGRALVQTYQPEHPALVAVASGDGTGFVEAELERRRHFGSPPFGRLVKLTVGLPDHAAAQAAATGMATQLRQRASGIGSRVAVLGPVPAYVARRGGRWRFHVVLRGPDPVALLGGDPGAPWSVDVDPESLL
ncbi:MAG TPA: primosomal protein N' [Candidatus Deferrimicrobium sp.]|nr:primosomal protein N' [Candidatus Deferrimicrobium sp.]